MSSPGHGIIDAMASVPLRASIALQSAVSRSESISSPKANGTGSQ